MSSSMRRRDFVAVVGGAVAWPVTARAQQVRRLPTIGFLGESSAGALSQRIAALVQRLHELGWFEGRTVAIEYRWGEGRNDRFAEIAAEFVRLKVDIIVTSGTPAVLAAKQATTTIPIVIANAGDPVATGMVASLAWPGGNITGLSLQANELTGKRLALLQEMLPNIRKLAILADVGNPAVLMELEEQKTVAPRLGLEPSIFEFRRRGPRTRLLRGTKPADIPVEQPTKFELVVNLTTAKALGLKIPETFLVRADEVIE
jgi:ABC-type uncharacterized transport system substrate-binding protein